MSNGKSILDLPTRTGLSIDLNDRDQPNAESRMPHNIRMHLTGYSRLRALPPVGDAGR
jgi:hypothetical protein